MVFLPWSFYLLSARRIQLCVLSTVTMKHLANDRVVGLAAALLLLAASGQTLAATNDISSLRAELATDGRKFTVTAPGFTACRGGFSATVRIAGKQKVLASTEGSAVGPPDSITEQTACGPADLTASAFRFEEEQVDLLFRFGRLPGAAGVLAQVGIRNSGGKPVHLVSATPVAMGFSVDGNPGEWLVTELDKTSLYAPPVVALGSTGTPLNVREYGGLYRPDGIGLFFGPVGTPIAYVKARIRRIGGGRVSLEFSADMSGVAVDPGETRWGQQVVLLMEPPRTALARWAEMVAKTHGARTSKGALSGWGSWYFLGKKVTGKDVTDVAETVLKSADRLRPAVIEIDEGYQDPSGKAETNPRFPEGLTAYAQHIGSTGARPGVFLYLKATNVSTAASELESRVRDTVGKGYTFLKVFVEPGFTMAGQNRTSFERYRDYYAAIRQAAGENTYLLGLDLQPSRVMVGAVDAGRTGRDVGRSNVRAAMNDVLRSYQLHDRWFAVDNDAYYMGTDIANVSKIEGGWPVVRTWMSMVGLSCGAAITSDPWHWESFSPYWRNIEVLTPPARERTEVVDLCTSRDWPRLVGHVTRDWGDWTVALLWNPGANEKTISLDFAQVGLDLRRRYAVWSFWDNRYLGVARGSWTTLALAPSASQHLRFTDLDSSPDRPVLIGSSLHIYCGAAEIKRVASSRNSMEIELTDAGARDGDLFVYSRYPLILTKATGCVVGDIVSAGENVWRIGIYDRKRGVSPQIRLDVMLPVARQPWFWLMIGVVAASLLFAAWRYIVGARFQRAHALSQERTRIAQDLHDDLGANLAEIAMMSELAQDQLAAGDPVRVQLNDIYTRAESNVRRLGEIVWAINPANDTLERFAGYLCKFAQDYLALAGVRCRLDVPEALPAVQLNSVRRHNLFLAAKEAIHNAVRHGRADEIMLRICASDGEIVVMIEDSGCGFDLTLHGASPRGITNMRKRLEQIGGKFALSSTPGKGTTIVLAVPFTANSGAI